MQTRTLTDLVRFDPDGPNAETVFETAHLWSQLVCLDRNQHLGPISDKASDGLFTVVAGEVVVQVSRSRRRLPQWATVLVPAGEEITVTNASADPAVVLVVAAPPPVPWTVTG